MAGVCWYEGEEGDISNTLSTWGRKGMRGGYEEENIAKYPCGAKQCLWVTDENA